MAEITDYVVTVPINFTHECAPGLKGLDAWVAEGDAAGDPETGHDWVFTSWGSHPVFQPGCRLYIVCEGRIRGYAPLRRITYYSKGSQYGKGPIGFVRRGGAVAVTINEIITGFRGYKKRWWDRSEEVAFPDWKTTDRR